MALSFDWYSDPALTTRISARLQFVIDIGGQLTADKVVYFGSPLADRIAQAAASPGVDDLLVDVADASALTGASAGDIKLATTASGLASAIAGQSLILGKTVAGGSGGAIAVWIRATGPAEISKRSDLSLRVADIAESKS